MARPSRSRYATVSIVALRRDLATIINRVAYAGETIVLTRHGRRIAGIVPIKELQSQELPEEMYPGMPIREALSKSLKRELGLSD